VAIAYDAVSNVAAGTGGLSWTHTPTGTPKGVLVLIAQNVGATDEVTGVTYGGTAMGEVALSPVLHTTGSEDGALYGYFLGSSVPTGAQTVSVSVNGTGSSKRAVAISYTALGDTAVEDTTIVEAGSGADPTATLTTSVETAIAGVLHSGVQAPSGIANGGSYTEIIEHDFGSQNAAWQRGTNNFASGSPTCGWTVATEENAVLAVAIKDTVILEVGNAEAGGTVTAAATGRINLYGQATAAMAMTATADANLIEAGAPQEVGEAEPSLMAMAAAGTAKLVQAGSAAVAGALTVVATAMRRVGEWAEAGVTVTAAASPRLLAGGQASAALAMVVQATANLIAAAGGNGNGGSYWHGQPTKKVVKHHGKEWASEPMVRTFMVR